MAYTSPAWPEYFLARGLSPTQQISAPELAATCGLEPEPLGDLLAVYQPLAGYLACEVAKAEQPLLIAINGAQGTGKSTAAAILKALLQTGYDLSVCALSIDDLYLGRAERQVLAEEVHPLLATRGVPGTHNLPLALDLLRDLRQANTSTVTKVPRFNKATDDCYSEADWDRVEGRPDLILFEGWCVGARPQRASDVLPPCNTLEAGEDRQAIWRLHVNQQLQSYQALFEQIDSLIMLKAPSFEQVYEWRQLQEDKLRKSMNPAALANSRVMSPAEIERFIAHYERLTRWMLSEMPGRADAVLSLNAQHQIDAIACHLL
ncbi:MAG TPA: phosphoribulokinase [Cellvibrionaceae bacterium]